MTMRRPKVIGVTAILFLACIASLMTNLALRPLPITPMAPPESALDRVLRTGTLRCGYYVFPPVTLRDANTNQLSGLSVDMMDIIAKKTGLKIEWTEEVGFGNWVPALEAGRFDAVCTPMWPDMALGRQAIFTRPFFYSGISPLVRADDKRFDGDLTKLNDPSVTFAAIKGDLQQFLAAQDFPKAHLLVEPASSDNATVTIDVATGKADVVLLDANALLDYNKTNPVKLKLLDPGHPLKAQAFALAFDRHEFALREFLDNAVSDMLLTGSIDQLLAKWQPAPGVYLRVADPYQPEAR